MGNTDTSRMSLEPQPHTLLLLCAFGALKQLSFYLELAESWCLAIYLWPNHGSSRSLLYLTSLKRDVSNNTSFNLLLNDASVEMTLHGMTDCWAPWAGSHFPRNLLCCPAFESAFERRIRDHLRVSDAA